jgi:BirA family biotin operon repressor/biotin-[acetyl-CoA-carboxylase] ligase
LHFEIVESTNEEGLRQLSAGCEDGLWIVAGEQASGRGRSGRRWQSPRGNLYASLVLRPGVTAAAAAQLSFVAALAAFDAVSARLSPARRAGLRLKWPNDVLADGAKIAGILIESLAGPEGRLGVVIGIGINVSWAPADTARPAAALGGDAGACAAVFDALQAAFETWLACWNGGRGFEDIRQAWLSRAHRPGEALQVNLNGSWIRGRFRGLDPGGALQLETAPGVVITVNAGDIYAGAQG